MTLWEFVKEHMLKNATQYICEGEAKMSFGDAATFAEIFAKDLKGYKCCAILCQSEMSAALSLLSCFAAGVTAVPLSMRYGQVHCQKILDAISPDGIILDDGGKIRVLKLKDSQYRTPEQRPALIMCTSGTTGKPKGAMLSDRNVMTNVEDIASYFELTESDTILISRPLYHCAVLTGEFLTALVKGARIYFYSEKFNPAEMLSLIDKHGITAFCGTPTLLSLMARLSKGRKVSPLGHIAISGECMGKEVGLRIAEAFPHSNIYHVYGLTEACPRVSYLPPDLFRLYPEYVGIPLPSVALKILNTDGEECLAGEEGILFVKGRNVMLGYYQEAQKTAAVLKDGWLCTGDIAVRNEVGLLQIKGRNDDLIIKSGMNIYPAEVEAAMKCDPRVKEILVYGIEGRLGKEIGMKLVGDFSDVAEAKDLCISILPPFQIPSIIDLVSELPKNGSGKIIRRA